MRRLPALLAAGVLLVTGCGGSSSSTVPEGEVIRTDGSVSEFRGGTVEPVAAAPELGLKNQDGKVVRLADLRGKVVMITFIYAQCPDICNLLAENMRLAKRKLGADGDRVALVAVSVDPKGDTPANVKAFLTKHRVAGEMEYLTGSRAELEPVWKAWFVAAQTSPENPALIAHTGAVWMVDPQGNRPVFFAVSAANAEDMAHDAKLLLDKG